MQYAPTQTAVNSVHSKILANSDSDKKELCSRIGERRRQWALQATPLHHRLFIGKFGIIGGIGVQTNARRYSYIKFSILKLMLDTASAKEIYAEIERQGMSGITSSIEEGVNTPLSDCVPLEKVWPDV